MDHSRLKFSILSFFYIALFCGFGSSTDRIAKIAIVGGGIGGTSCAYFLSKLFEKNANITVFERDTIGGRIGLINVDGKYYESGASILHTRNKYMKSFAKLLGLPHAKYGKSMKFGVFDGKDFVFLESDIIGFTYLKLLWHYGLSVFKLPFYIDSMLNDFSRIYEAQNKELAFTTVQSMLDYMNPLFPNMTQTTIASLLSKQGYSERFIEELAQSIMMVNYGQTSQMSGFAGFVSLAGSGENLFSIKGGNKLVPEGLLQESNAIPINGDVKHVTLLSDGTFELEYLDISNDEIKSEIYNIVILAAPLISGNKNIKFNNFKKSFQQFEMPFHRTVSTYVKGELNQSYFQSKAIPEVVLTFSSHLIFNSLALILPTSENEDRKHKVYKIFSQKPLTEEEINKLFRNVEMVKEKDWLAYPHYKAPEELKPFLMYPGLYYTNAIELAASALEMSAIAAKNVALLAFNLQHNLIDKVDQHQRIYRDEL